MNPYIGNRTNKVNFVSHDKYLMSYSLQWKKIEREILFTVCEIGSKKHSFFSTNLTPEKGKKRKFQFWTQSHSQFREIQSSDYDQIRYNDHGIDNIFRNICDMHDIIAAIPVRNQPCVSILLQIWCVLFRGIDKLNHPDPSDAVPIVWCPKFTVSNELEI